MRLEHKIEVSKAFTRTQSKEMKEGILKHFRDRVQALEEVVKMKSSEIEKLRMQLGTISGLAKDAQENLEKATGHNELVRESLIQLEVTLRKIEKFHLSHDNKSTDVLQNPAAEPLASESKAELEDRPLTVVSESECDSIPPTPVEGLQSHQSTAESEDVADLFDFHADDGIIARDSPNVKTPTAQQQDATKPGATPITPARLKHAATQGNLERISDPFAIDDAAVLAMLESKAKAGTGLSQGPGSHQTVATVKPMSSNKNSTSVIAPFQKLADVMRQPLQESGTPAREGIAPQQRATSLGDPIEAVSGNDVNPIAAKVPPSMGSAIYTAKFTTLPPNFNHAGNYPNMEGTFYEPGQLCERASYRFQSVPVLRLENVPKDISVADLLTNLSGGPLYRISTAKGTQTQDDTFRHVRITFIHIEHAAAFLEFAKKNHGIYIKGCTNRIQVVVDPREKPNVISYTTFRKIMTENATRMVFITGFKRDFWNTRKLRDLIVAAVDKLRVEDPSRYQFKEPICDKVDILSVKAGIKEHGLEALIELRSIGWAILVRTALNNLQHPEGFYMERVEGEIGPSLNPHDNPKDIPTLHTWWVADPVDRPLDKMQKNIDGNP